MNKCKVWNHGGLFLTGSRTGEDQQTMALVLWDIHYWDQDEGEEMVKK